MVRRQSWPAGEVGPQSARKSLSLKIDECALLFLVMVKSQYCFSFLLTFSIDGILKAYIDA